MSEVVAIYRCGLVSAGLETLTAQSEDVFSIPVCSSGATTTNCRAALWGRGRKERHEVTVAVQCRTDFQTSLSAHMPYDPRSPLVPRATCVGSNPAASNRPLAERAA